MTLARALLAVVAAIWSASCALLDAWVGSEAGVSCADASDCADGEDCVALADEDPSCHAQCGDAILCVAGEICVSDVGAAAGGAGHCFTFCESDADCGNAECRPGYLISEDGAEVGACVRP